MDAKLKVSRSVTKAAFAYPFFGSCALALKVYEDNSIPTACTNGMAIMWNREFVDLQTEPKMLGLLCHEIMHVVLQHCQEHKGYPDHKMCNIAMDIVINASLKKEGFELPDGGIVPEARFDGMTWKQVYNIIKDEGEYQDMAKNPDLMDVIENSGLSEAEKEELKARVEEMVIRAAEAQKNSGVGKLPAGIDSIIKDIRKPKVDWRGRIRALVQANFPEDYTMRRPNKKYLQSAGIYMPSMEGKKIGTLAVGLDTSGSMGKEDQIKILTELNALSQELKIEKIMVFYTDAEVARIEEYNEGEVIDELKLRGGGGTSFVPVFDYIHDQGIEVDQMIYASDMEVWEQCFPKIHPEYPVMWLSTRSEYPVPFGDLVVVNNE